MSIPHKVTGLLLDLAPRAQPIGIAELAPPGGLMLIVPHPDDETLGCGMALAEAAQEGRPVVLVLLTDGEGSHPGSRTVSPDQLVEIRRTELEEALASLLGGRSAHLERLSLPDGRSEPSQLGAARYTKLIAPARAHDVRSIWTTWRYDPHCDHQTAAAFAIDLAHDLHVPLWEFPVWGRFCKTVSILPKLRRFAPVSPLAKDRKCIAMAAYRSQLTAMIDDDPSAFRMPPALTEHFATHAELFIGN